MIVDVPICSATLTSFAAKDLKLSQNCAVEHSCGSPLTIRDNHFKHLLSDIFSCASVVFRQCFSVNFKLPIQLFNHSQEFALVRVLTLIL